MVFCSTVVCGIYDDASNELVLSVGNVAFLAMLDWNAFTGHIFKSTKKCDLPCYKHETHVICLKHGIAHTENTMPNWYAPDASTVRRPDPVCPLPTSLEIDVPVSQT